MVFGQDFPVQNHQGFKQPIGTTYTPATISEIEDSEEKNIKVKRITLEYLGKFRKQINSVIQIFITIIIKTL